MREEPDNREYGSAAAKKISDHIGRKCHTVSRPDRADSGGIFGHTGGEQYGPFIELKEPFTKAELQKIVRKVKESGLLERTYFISMYKQNLLSLKEIGVATKENLQYVYGAEEENKTQAVNDSVINWCIANEINLDVRYTLVTASDVFRLHEAGREVNVWTINQLEKAFELLTDTQVDMLTTEYYLNS